MRVEVPPCYRKLPLREERKRGKKELVSMRRITEVLTVPSPRVRKARYYLCASAAAFMVAMLMIISAAPARAQGDSGPNHGPNGAYYGPYDYCVWSAYACGDYTSSAEAQGDLGLTYGPSGPYYGPYDYCVWSAYACAYY